MNFIKNIKFISINFIKNIEFISINFIKNIKFILIKFFWQLFESYHFYWLYASGKLIYLLCMFIELQFSIFTIYLFTSLCYIY